jgi:hypothetical protein
VTFALILWMAFADLASVKAEPALDRRSELALANADRAIDDARKAYADGDGSAQKAALDEIQESVQVSFSALDQMHGKPRNSKYYKHAELKTRALIRRLNGFREEVGFESQQSIDAVVKSVSEVHDRLVDAIMSKEKK